MLPLRRERRCRFPTATGKDRGTCWEPWGVVAAKVRCQISAEEAVMTVSTDPTATTESSSDPRWAGTPLATGHWLEVGSGFPPGGVVESGLGSSSDVISTARRMTLSRRQVDEIVAFAELLAGEALDRDEREELQDDIVDAFEDSPVSATKFFRPLTGGVARMGTAGPIERAGRRLQALTATWTIEQRRIADGAGLNPVMEVVSRHNPLIRQWSSAGIVLVADALTARAEQHQLVLSLIGAEAEATDRLTERLIERTSFAGTAEIAELAASQVRLMCTRAWLRDLGDTALTRLREELEPAVRSALDVDIVVQQTGFRASMAVAPTLGRKR